MNIKNSFIIFIVIVLTSNLTSCSLIEIGEIYKPKDKLKWCARHGEVWNCGGIDYYRSFIVQGNQHTNDTLFIGIKSSHYDNRRALFGGTAYVPLPLFPAFLVSFFWTSRLKFSCGILLRSHSDLSAINKDKMKIIINKNPNVISLVDVQNIYRMKNYNSNTGMWQDSVGYNCIYCLIKSDMLAKTVKNVSIDFDDDDLLDSPINLVRVPKLFYTKFIFY